MTDIFHPKKRRDIMQRIKGQNTKPELVVRSVLHRMGYRFTLHSKKLPGKPDIVLPRHGKVIFVHGCFWHGHRGCPRAARPTTNVEFWDKKLSGNIERDKKKLAALRRQGWKALVIWQCQVKNLESIQRRLSKFLE